MRTRVSKDDVHIRHRPPCYIECFTCGDFIEDNDPKAVADKANRRGWVYDTEADQFFCEQCKTKKVNDDELVKAK